MNAKQRRLQARREERERAERQRRWHNIPASLRSEGAGHPTHEEEMQARHYAELLEELQRELDLDLVTLVDLMKEVAQEKGMHWYDEQWHARWHLARLISGEQASRRWVYDVIDATREEFDAC